jgi:hypothetical protein
MSYAPTAVTFLVTTHLRPAQQLLELFALLGYYDFSGQRIGPIFTGQESKYVVPKRL